MATEINQGWVSKLATEVKKNPGNSERYYSEKCNVPMGQILRHLVLAELQANPSLKIPATGAGIEKARNQGLRWPRVAAYAGISEARAKQLFEEKTGTSARESYTGRGRNFAGTTPAKRGAAGKRSGVQVVQKGTSGRRGAAAKAQPQKRGAANKPAAGRRGTRAGASPK